MNRERPHHPFQLAIEQCWDGGRTPRILVLGDRPNVVLPQYIVAKHEGAPIAIDLDPSYPLKPEFYGGFMRAELAFAGSVVLCSFPWDAILMVQDLELGTGFVRLVAKPSEQKRPQPPLSANLALMAKPLDVDVRIGGPGTDTHQPPTTRGEARGFKPRVIDGGKKED